MSDKHNSDSTSIQPYTKLCIREAADLRQKGVEGQVLGVAGVVEVFLLPLKAAQGGVGNAAPSTLGICSKRNPEATAAFIGHTSDIGSVPCTSPEGF